MCTNKPNIMTPHKIIQTLHMTSADLTNPPPKKKLSVYISKNKKMIKLLIFMNFKKNKGISYIIY